MVTGYPEYHIERCLERLPKGWKVKYLDKEMMFPQKPVFYKDGVEIPLGTMIEITDRAYEIGVNDGIDDFLKFTEKWAKENGSRVYKEAGGLDYDVAKPGKE